MPTAEGPLQVFLLHWNEPEGCARAVRGFLGQTVPIRLTVIDNGSLPEKRKALDLALPNGVERLDLSANLGWGGGLNAGLRRWLGERMGSIAVVAAHDALPEPSCLAMLQEAMMRDGRLGVVSPEYGEPMVPKYGPILGARILSAVPRKRGFVEAVDYVHGALMAFRRECLEEIGLFDERYFAYGDEVEITLRARKAGWKAAIVWGAIVVNPASGTPKPILTYLWARSGLLMAETYGSRWRAWVRAGLMLLHNGRLALEQRGSAGRALRHARLLAIRDYWQGRFGSPPFEELTQGDGR
ncbi:N-acetylglucosaminyl-diphospho-decaprenol L-rhamnosyltransferase [Methylacidimicrobium cyclopophantes]|uniref:N-acetylglucosaminyl-diphospho-decaprenol L-rhamnosyltransferase n=1 Tax=Methylacidimicrobium cyclopophantes TaxID=1041766 RepID=A0A5E6MDX3_9BACT|nr:N-acetylglucosaminyl-diphospho-decaprenol L-rhamnosyltransferase [Methylacidimicrobium cyclopophantes]